jgi:hypothetical protein
VRKVEAGSLFEFADHSCRLPGVRHKALGRISGERVRVDLRGHWRSPRSVPEDRRATRDILCPIRSALSP